MIMIGGEIGMGGEMILAMRGRLDGTPERERALPQETEIEIGRETKTETEKGREIGTETEILIPENQPPHILGDLTELRRAV